MKSTQINITQRAPNNSVSTGHADTPSTTHTTATEDTLTSDRTSQSRTQAPEPTAKALLQPASGRNRAVINLLWSDGIIEQAWQHSRRAAHDIINLTCCYTVYSIHTPTCG